MTKGTIRTAFAYAVAGLAGTLVLGAAVVGGAVIGGTIGSILMIPETGALLGALVALERGGARESSKAAEWVFNKIQGPKASEPAPA